MAQILYQHHGGRFAGAEGGNYVRSQGARAAPGSSDRRATSRRRLRLHGGEGGINGVGAVIAAAIDDAIGIPGGTTRLPATPQRIKAMLREAAQRGHRAAEG